MAFKSKAECMFELKVKHCIENRDWDLLAEVGMQYEAYLKLIAPIEEMPVLVMTNVDEVEVNTSV